MGETEQKEERVSIKERRRKKQGGLDLSIISENKSMLVLFVVIVAVLAVILASIMALKVAVVPVCVIVLIEIALAICLQKVPIWLHGVVSIAQIVAGVLCGMTVFMVMCVVVYWLGIIALRIMRN